MKKYLKAWIAISRTGPMKVYGAFTNKPDNKDNMWDEFREAIEIQAVEDLEAQVKVLMECLGFYGDTDNWMSPDHGVPYYTLWDDGSCIGAEKAIEALAHVQKMRE